MAACLRDSQRSCLERNDEAHAIAMTDREVETDTTELVQQQSNLEVYEVTRMVCWAFPLFFS